MTLFKKWFSRTSPAEKKDDEPYVHAEFKEKKIVIEGRLILSKAQILMLLTGLSGLTTALWRMMSKL